MASPTNTQFAVATHVLTYLAWVGCEPGASSMRAVSSQELAASTQVNPVHIRRVLGPLRQAGLLTSRAGQQGGWQLARPADEISLAEIFDLLRGDEPLLGIHGPSPDCPVGSGVQQAMVGLDDHLTHLVRTELAAVSVADLLHRSGLLNDSPALAGRA